MKISTLLRFLFCAFVATALSLNASAQTQAGQIIAKKVQGEVFKVSASGTRSPLKNDEKLVETDTINTAKGSSVVLVFENGSSLRIGPESQLAIEEFKMDEPAGAVDLASLKEEPSRSKTVLNLSYGELVGEVKKLKTEDGSTYSIKTQVGAAGIRGTIFRIIFRPSSDGKAFFTIATAEGKVVMENVSTQEIPIDAGKEVVVQVDTTDASKTVIGDAHDIPAATLALINAAVAEIVQTLKETIIDNSGNTEGKKEEEKKEEVPPLKQVEQDTTPGAGA